MFGVAISECHTGLDWQGNLFLFFLFALLRICVLALVLSHTQQEEAMLLVRVE